MPFHARIFWQPKDEGFWKEYEDAYAVNSARAIAAIADGVASAMFSGKWARLLVETVINGPPDPTRREEFLQWLGPLRAEWERQIDRPHLPYFQKLKLQEYGGGFSTLLWLETLPQDGNESVPGAWRYRAVALGDCCLFHLRGGQILGAFPMQRSADFERDPAALASVRGGQDRTLVFQTCESEYLPDDHLVLATDALAAWIFRQTEAGNPVPWEQWAGMSDEEFAAWLREIRKALAIRCDDTTLILLKPVPALAEPLLEAPEPAAAELPVVAVAEPSGDAPREEPVAEPADILPVTQTGALPAAQEEAAPSTQEEAVPVETVGIDAATEQSPVDTAGAEPQELQGQLHGNGETPSQPDGAVPVPGECVVAGGDKPVASDDQK